MFYIPENQDFVLKSKVFVFHKKVKRHYLKNSIHLEVNCANYCFLLFVCVYLSIYLSINGLSELISKSQTWAALYKLNNYLEFLKST